MNIAQLAIKGEALAKMQEQQIEHFLFPNQLETWENMVKPSSFVKQRINEQK